jgi:hypothetical protein
MLRFVEKADEDSRLLPRAASSRRPFPLPPLPRTAALRLIRPYHRDLPIGHRELLLKICLTPGWPPPPSCCASPFSGPSPLPQSPHRHHTSHLPLPRLSMLYLRPSSLRARPCGPSPYSLVFISSFTISFDKDQSLPPFCSRFMVLELSNLKSRLVLYNPNVTLSIPIHSDFNGYFKLHSFTRVSEVSRSFPYL